jgi:hypothetical protein|tara:strand:+ start:711 stop:1355 length:645 start_codon:yes stop_codon:yes gene_type:complete
VNKKIIKKQLFLNSKIHIYSITQKLNEMVEAAKAKINMNEGIIEVEGSEDFIIKLLDKYGKKFVNESVTVKASKKKSLQKDSKNVRQETMMKKHVDQKPIPINLEGDEHSPSLSELYAKKSPQTHQEAVTFFLYYVTKYLGIQNVHMGHIVSCYDEVNAKKPLQIERLFQEIKIFTGWLESGDLPQTAKITISGENFVENDLPGHSKTKLNVIQ